MLQKNRELFIVKEERNYGKSNKMLNVNIILTKKENINLTNGG